MKYLGKLDSNKDIATKEYVDNALDSYTPPLQGWLSR